MNDDRGPGAAGLRPVLVARAVLGAGLFLLIAAPPAHAYVGPGAGFAAIGSLLTLILAFLAAFVSLLTLPFRLLLSLMRGRRAYRRATVRRVVSVGLDGLDPRRTARLMREGRLPHFVRLAEQGRFTPLGTTHPPLSPVAWSSFATGVEPSRHAMFDFLNRDLNSYVPVLSSSSVEPPKRFLDLGSWRIPLGRARVRLLRRSKAFWSYLGEHGVFSTILRVPITFPPERFRGVCLSAMCTPDLRGTQGSFTLITGGEGEGKHTGGLRVSADRRDGSWHALIPGPENPIRRDGRTLEAPIRVKPLPGGREAEVRLDGTKLVLGLHEYSPWLHVSFRAGFGVKIRGICRLYLNSLDPDLSLYVTPIQIDPERPALPISHPKAYSAYLAKLLGPFSTLGLAEDTWALNERALDEDGFLAQARLIQEEREASFFNGLRKTRRGVVATVFDITDRVQHMFYRYQSEGHPARRPGEGSGYESVIDDLYVQMDDLLRRVLEEIGDDTLLFVLSDHGFADFRRGVNLNAWLRDEGYLALRDGGRTCGDYFEAVDWSRTRAYTFGLTGIYLNVRGRESRGTVEPEDALGLAREIAAKLEGLVDGAAGRPAVRRAHVTADLYPGPYLDRGPEVLPGFADGYRASWEAALGAVTEEVFHDNVKAWSGDHCVDAELVPGVLFCNRVFAGDSPRIMDLAPTILKLFGVEPPRHMDGVPLFDGPPRTATPAERETWRTVAAS